MKPKSSLRRMMVLSIALTLFLGCVSPPIGLIPPLEIDLVEVVPIPSAPEMLPVHFTDTGSGLLLTYDDYRALETNIIRMRLYQDELRALIEAHRDAAGDKADG